MAGTQTPESAAEAEPSRWARALDGGSDDARTALRELAGSYWYCAYAWWRRAGLDGHKAATATLACFTRWLGEAAPRTEDSGAARLREWLPARLAKLAAQGVKLTGPAAIEIEPAWAAQRFADEPPGEPDPIFQRRWALTVLEFSTTTLQAEYAARGEDALFTELLPFAGFEPSDDERYAAAASRTGRTTGAMRKAVFDFRTRQRELLRAFVADTVREAADAESELTALLCAVDATEVVMTPLPGAESAPASAPLPTALRALRPDEGFARAMQSVRMTHAGHGGWQPPTIEEAARLFPQYEVLALLGRGGMGAVYQARQIELDRLVAIKLLPLEVSVDKDFADRFRREARAMAKLNHPNIIAVYDFGTTREGHLFFVMEFVEGANLHDIIHGHARCSVGSASPSSPTAGDRPDRLTAPTLQPADALVIITGVCDALAYAHGKGIVHRDIKPANVMVSTESQVKVADFGLARLTDPAADALGHTVTGTVMGTPDYMAPEQKRGMNVDHRADIYSVGVMLYEALCQETPQGAFEPPSTRTGCDPRIDANVLKAMQQAPDRRYQSTQEMRTDVTGAHSQITSMVKPKVVTAPPPAPPKQPAPKPAGPPRAAGKKSKTPLFIGAAACVLALAAGVTQWAKHGGTRSGASPTFVGAGGAEQGRAGARPSEPLEPGAIRLWDSPEKIPQGPGIAWKDDALFVTDRSIVRTVENSRDLLVRCAVRLNAEAEGASLGIRNVGTPKEPRRYKIRVTPREKSLSLRVQAGGQERVLQQWPFPRAYAPEEWLRLELRAVGEALTVSADGRVLGTVNDATIPQPGQLTFFADAHGYFRDIVYVPLDKPETTVSTPAAPTDIRTFGGHRYQLVRDPINWTTANTKAKEMGGHLATVTTKEEDGFVKKEFFAALKPDQGFWIGGKPTARGTFRWTTGEPFSLQAWLPGKPERKGDFDQSVAMRYFRTREPEYFAWDDVVGSALPNVIGFLVEWDDAGGAASISTPATATKGAPFENTLGMKFVPVPITGGPTGGQRVLFSIWETRGQDYAAFVKEEWRERPKPNFEQGPTHPAVNVSWEDARAFCTWLTVHERRADRLGPDQVYRLPSDHEWSCAVGIGEREDAQKQPIEKTAKIGSVFPWGTQWPPPKGAGNYASEELQPLLAAGKHPTVSGVISGYSDGFAETSPVGSFAPNSLGLYDLGGNVWQWCGDQFDAAKPDRVLRGAAWTNATKYDLQSSTRDGRIPVTRDVFRGFRVVLAPAP